MNNLFSEAEAKGFKNIPYSEELKVLCEPITVDGHEFKNRMVIQPMEGCDAKTDGKPSDLTKRRYMRFAEGGAGLIWFEAVSVEDKGKANPRMLCINEDNVDDFAALIYDMKNAAAKELGYEPKLIMQATHAGRYSKPDGHPKPIIAYNNPIFEKDAPIAEERIISDDELKKLEEKYGEAALLAQKAGFDGIDIKCCHRYLGSELLSAYTRKGEYGGSFENRTRFLRNGISNAKAAASGGFIVTTRLNVYDGFEYPYGFGVSEGSGTKIDLSEPKKLVDILHNQQGVDIINISIGNPYVNPHVGRPSRTKENLGIEDPLEGIDRMYYCIGEIQRAFPELAVIGSGVSYFGADSAKLAAGAINGGYMKLQGFGRMAFAYPDFAKDIMRGGNLERSRSCVACGKCTELMRAGSVTGCVVRDNELYVPLYKKYVLGIE